MSNTAPNVLYQRFSTSNIKIAFIFTTCYLSWIHLSMGLRSEHLVSISVLLLMFFTGKTTRNIVLGFGFFILYAIIYDSLRVFPNYELNPVHVIEPYNLEKSLFGVELNGNKVIPGEYLFDAKSDLKSFLAGAFYLTWVPLPVLFALYLFFKDKKLLVHFTFAFLLTNLIGFVGYYLYPAAPPWYKLYYGDIVDHSLLGSAAGLVEFDRIIGTPLFENMYTRNSNVFAAIPSLHAAYPIVLFYFGLKHKVKWMYVLFFIDIIGIWYGAVYSLHHYIVDLLLGGLCALIGILIYEKVFNRKGGDTFLDKYAALIE